MNAKHYIQTGLLEEDLYSLNLTISRMATCELAKKDKAFCKLVNDLRGSFKALEAEVNKRIE
jgi:hypothetical protein